MEKKNLLNSKPFVVPIVFGLADYEKAYPLYWWIFEVYLNYAIRNDSAIIAQENYFKQEVELLDEFYSKPLDNEDRKKKLNQTKKIFLKYSISNSDTKRVFEHKNSSYKSEISLLNKTSPIYHSILENLLDQIESDYNRKIDALMTWIWNPTLETIAKERNISLISLELSPIRKIHGNKNYNTTLCYFQFSNKYDSIYCENLYLEFLNAIETQEIQIFSRKELLTMFLNTQDLNLLKEIQGPATYELGLSPGFERDPFFEVYSDSKSEITCKKIEALFDSSDVSIRYHPNLENSRGNPSWSKDTSAKSIYWVSQCRRIVSYVSNIAFDAMLFGRTSYILSSNMPFSFKAVKAVDWIDDSIVDSLYLNFMIFGYFTHWNLIFNPDYIAWRLTDPTILEIFQYNRKYVLELLGLNPERDSITQLEILGNVHKLDNKKAYEIEGYSIKSEIKCLREKIEKKDTLLRDLNKENEWRQRELTTKLAKEGKQNRALAKEVQEFRTFKKGMIWKLLTKYRKFRNKLRKFLPPK